MRDEYISRPENEIDLVELLITLWRGKWKILLITVLFGILGLACAKLLPKTWTSRAEIAPAKYAELADYIALRKRYEIISDAGSSNIAGQLFNNLKQELKSRDTLVQYFSGSEFYLDELSKEGFESDSLDAQILLEEIVNENVSIEFPEYVEEDKDERLLFLTVKYSAPEPSIARKELNEFLKYVSAKSFSEYKRNFMAQLKNLISELEAVQTYQKNVLEISKNSTLDELKQALKISNAAGIDKLVSLGGNETNSTLAYLITSNVIASDANGGGASNSVRSLYPFMMGSKNLSSQVDVLENNPTLYPASYYQRQDNIKELKAISAEFEELDKVDVFYYVSSPNYPVKNDGASTIVKILIGLFLGFIIGITVVITDNAVENYKRSKK